MAVEAAGRCLNLGGRFIRETVGKILQNYFFSVSYYLEQYEIKRRRKEKRVLPGKPGQGIQQTDKIWSVGFRHARSGRNHRRLTNDPMKI